MGGGGGGEEKHVKWLSGIPGQEPVSRWRSRCR
jgi:hypothetical protein